jgi:hypothetical protein
MERLRFEDIRLFTLFQAIAAQAKEFDLTLSSTSN